MSPDDVERTLRADAARNRIRILDAADRVFSEQGLGAPIDCVAEVAGVGVGTLYRHFPTKDDLFEAIAIARLDHLVEAASDASTSADPAKALREFLEQMARHAMAKHDLFDAMAAAGIDVKSRCASKIDELRSIVGGLIARAQDVGEVRPDVTSEEVIGLVIGACHAAADAGIGLTGCLRMVGVIADGISAQLT